MRKKFTLTATIVLLFAVYSTQAQITAYSRTVLSGLTYSNFTLGTAGPTGDDASTTVTLPFTFTYNGTGYTSARLCTNGWISFNSASTSNTLTPSDLFTTSGPNLEIAAWHGDGNANGANGGSITSGIHPTLTDVYVFQWRDVSGASGGGASATLKINHQIWLYGPASSNPGRVEILYGTSAGAISTARSLGVENATGGPNNYINALDGGFTTTTTASAWPGNGNGYRFDPPLPCSGTPLTPTIPASIGFCQPSGTVTIPASNLTTGVTGITYQWEESDDNGGADPWANAVGGSGATTATYTSPVLTAGIYYRLVATCTNGGATATSASCQVVSVNCSFNITKSAATYTSIAGTGTSATGWRNGNNTDDNMSTAQPIGFNFNYKGVNYSQFLVSTSGFMTFNTGTTAVGNGTGAYGYVNTNLSSTTGTLNTLAPFYEDLVTPGNPTTAAGLAAAIKYQVSGSAPNRVLTVEWIGMETFNNAGPNLNFQVKLYETTNVIEYVYGTMELFNGTANYGYSYTVGLNGPTVSATPQVSELQTQQADNEQNFSATPKNDLDRFMDCNVKYTFTPGNYSGAGTPPALTNDEPAGALTVPVNNTPCTNLCGTYYTSNTATASAGIPVCTAVTPGTPDDDVWFSFTATTAQQNITVRGGGGYDAVVQLFSDAGITSITCVNATGAGLTETINATGLTPGNVYYVRIYHAGTGSNNAAAGTGNTTTGGVPDFSLCINEVVAPPSNDNPCGAHALTVGNGSCTPYQDNTVGGKTQFVTATNTTLNGVVTPTCSGAGAVQDVWFSFVAPACNAVIIKTIPVAGVNTAFEIDSVVSGTCGAADLLLGVKSCTNPASTAQPDSIVFTNFIPGNTYYVRVYHHPSGQGGAPVSNSQFSICIYSPPAPTCTVNNSPAPGATNVSTTTTLSWTAAAGATEYDVYLDGNNPPTTLVATVPGTSYSVTPALSFGTQYYWYVVPKNCAGAATGCNSSATSFTTAAPPPVNDTICGAIALTLGGPQDCKNTLTATSVGDPTLSCSTPNNTVWYTYTPAVSGPVLVRTEIPGASAAPLNGWVAWYTATGTCPSPPGLTLTQTGDCSEFGQTGAGDVDSLTSPVLTAGTTYYIMIDGFGGDAGDFCISIVATPPPSCPTTFAPANNGFACPAASGTVLSWSAAANASTYNVYFNAGSGPATSLVSAGQAGTSFNVGVLAPGVYSWRIVPYNTNGDSTVCTNLSFTRTAGPGSSVSPAGPVTFCAPGSQTLTGTTSSTNQRYSWQNNNSNIPGATASTYAANASGSYRLIVTDTLTGCSDTSAAVIITVNPQPSSPVATATPAVVCIGDNVTLNATASAGYTINPAGSETFIDIDANPSTTSLVTLSDDSEHNFNMPRFTFNGITYTNARVGMNGVIALGSSTGEVSTANAALPSTANSAGNIFLAPWWDDLDVIASPQTTIKLDTIGSKFIIQWTNTAHNFTLPATDSVKFQVQLDTANGQIHFVYDDVSFGNATYNAGASATVGIQWNSTNALQYSFNTASLAAAQCITFAPAALNYSWTGPNGFTSSLQSPTRTSLTSLDSGLYTVTITNPVTTCSNTASVTVTVVPAGAIAWTGAVDTNWNNAGNWSCGGVPTITSEVIVNGGLPRYPVVNLNVEIRKLTVKPGASVTVGTGFDLKLNGN